MCVQVFHLTLVVFVAAMAAAGCEANKEIYSTCANSHTHTHTAHRQSQLNAILHGILKIFCFAQFLFFRLLFGCQLCVTFPQWEGGKWVWQGRCSRCRRGCLCAALFILLCAHYAASNNNNENRF